MGSIMKIVHGPLPLQPQRRAGRVGSPRRVAIIALLALLVIGLVALGVYWATAESHTSGMSARHPARHALDRASFARMPGAEAELIVAQTASDAQTLEPLTAEDARAANARLKAAVDVGPAAPSFYVKLGDGVNYLRALDCMTAAIYYEAANEPVEGQRAVAQVVMNRSRHLAYPHTICGVVYQGSERATGCQFSFTCDGSLRRTPSVDGWRRARSVASAALSGLVYAPVGLATHYHADYVLPYWAPTLVKQTLIGRHIFYRWPGTWGTLRSFAVPYDAKEPDIWANAKMADSASGITGLAAIGPVPLPVQATERPVLLGSNPVAEATASLTAAPSTAAASSRKSDGRVYLMSQAPAPQSAPRRQSVTGGVIMLGPAIIKAPAESEREADISVSK